jgi:hypothetical protein
MNVKHVLSDKFVEFSTKAAEVHTKIKELKTKFQADLKALTHEAEELTNDFVAWQKDQDKDPVTKLTEAVNEKNKTTLTINSKV